MQSSNVLSPWHFIQSRLQESSPVVLLYVVESQGSSPGRRGFYMAASEIQCIGTIGGGIMEYKLVELSREMIRTRDTRVKIITQYHDKEHATDQSGMICSGMQRVVIVPILSYHDSLMGCLNAVNRQTHGQLVIATGGLSFDSSVTEKEGWYYQNDTDWYYRETLGRRPCVHIIGAGHVSLALSELLSKIGYSVIVYDDRADLNTLEFNQWAKKQIVDYERIAKLLVLNKNDSLVIMTIGYRSDKIVLRQLIDMPCQYIGMLGSLEKVKQVVTELRHEGFSEEQLQRVHAPIGLPIHSQSAYEIAVSIAAEMIKERNSSKKSGSISISEAT
jgi:xanthine dehydrogenase accessory factor